MDATTQQGGTKFRGDIKKQIHKAASKLLQAYFNRAHAFMRAKRVGYFSDSKFIFSTGDLPLLDMAQTVKECCGFFGDEERQKKAQASLDAYIEKTDGHASTKDVLDRMKALAAATSQRKEFFPNGIYIASDGYDPLRSQCAKAMDNYMGLVAEKFSGYAKAVRKPRLFSKGEDRELKMRGSDHDLALLANDAMRLPRLLSLDEAMIEESCEFYRQFFKMQDKFVAIILDPDLHRISEEILSIGVACDLLLGEKEKEYKAEKHERNADTMD